MSQTDLAKSAGMTARYVTRIENDPQNLTIDNIERLATALGVSVGQILGTEHQHPLPPSQTADTLDDAIRVLQAYRALV